MTGSKPSVEAVRARLLREAPAALAPTVHSLRASRTPDETKRGRVAWARKGFKVSGQTPFGYRRVAGISGAPNELEVAPAEAHVVRTIFQLYVYARDGTYSLADVIHELGVREITTRSGKPWSRQGLSFMLQNRTYRGRCVYALSSGVIDKPGRHRAIVGASVFAKAVAKLARQNKRKRTRKSAEPATGRAETSGSNGDGSLAQLR